MMIPDNPQDNQTNPQSEQLQGNAPLWDFVRSAPAPVKIKIGTVMLMATAVVVCSIWIIGQLVKLQISERKVASKVRPLQLAQVGLSYELKDVALAFPSRNQRRTGYAQFTLVMDLPSQASKHKMELNRAKLLNTINEVGSRFHLEDFEYSGIFTDFKDALQKELQGQFGSESPTQLSFREWVMN